jgi:parallel beta-helix repeat protein
MKSMLRNHSKSNLVFGILAGTFMAGLSLPTLAGTYVIDKKANIVVDGRSFTNSSGDCILIQNSRNITIRNARITYCKGVGIRIYKSSNILIEKNYFEEVASGVYAVAAQVIKVNYNEFKNVNGPYPRGQFVQFNGVQGDGNRVNYNKGVNILGQSYPEDLVNMYNSCGTVSDPIQIIGNRFTGGGPSTHGGGILAGDSGQGCYVVVKGNTLINPGQYGIGIIGGHHIQILDNFVYAKQQPFTNVGIYVYTWPKATYKYPCYGHTVQNNKVDWTNKYGKKNPRWTSGSCGTINGWNNNSW